MCARLQCSRLVLLSWLLVPLQDSLEHQLSLSVQTLRLKLTAAASAADDVEDDCTVHEMSDR